MENNKKRARTEGQKQDRRGAIEQAARAYLTESGFDGVTMSGLAKRAGLAKGTLYLYVRTKEELFLSLYVRALEAWVERVRETLQPGQGAAQIAQALSAASRADPHFLPLYARLTAVIEANVSEPALIDAKREMMGLVGGFTAHLGAVLELPEAEAFELSAALLVLLQGAAQFDISAQLDGSNYPEDVQQMLALSRFETRFESAVALLLRGR